MIRRLRAWWHRRRVREACETCGASLKPKDAHHVTSGFSVDAAEIGISGGGSISATFCRLHCPGGCDHSTLFAVLKNRDGSEAARGYIEDEAL